jgi:hypothetical protein
MDSRLQRAVTRGAVTLPDNDLATDMYEAMIEVRIQGDPSVFLGTKPIADWITDDVVLGTLRWLFGC